MRRSRKPSSASRGKKPADSLPTVKDLMRTTVHTVKPNDTIDRVIFLLYYEKIRHLPVIERQQIVGIVSDRDVYKALGPRGRLRLTPKEQENSPMYFSPKRVRHIMRRGVVTVAPDAHLGTAAAIMARRKIGALPVVRNNKLIGIITSTDLLKAFAEMTTLMTRAATG